MMTIYAKIVETSATVPTDNITFQNYSHLVDQTTQQNIGHLWIQVKCDLKPTDQP